MKWPVIEDREPDGTPEMVRKADPNGTYPLMRGNDGHAAPLKQRVAATVRAAQARRALELQEAADRARSERQAVVDKARSALLSILSDDTIDVIVGRHAGLGELNAGALKITKSGIELLRSSGAGASHQVGDKLDLRFEGGILQAGQQLKVYEVEARISELLTQGIKIEITHDASAQSLMISFDYGSALN